VQHRAETGIGEQDVGPPPARSIGGSTVLLVPGSTCWRAARAERASVIVDVEAYYAAARDAMSRATRSIHILGWAFDPDTPFTPARKRTGKPEQWGPFLRDVAHAHPDVDVRLLIWKSSLPIAATQNFFPHWARVCFQNSPVNFRLDASIPFGACHHQKVIVIDDRIAFAGGCDVGPDRWDTSLHTDSDARRRRKTGLYFDNRHETMAVVDGEAAEALGQLFRNRWERSSQEILLAPSEPATGPDPWPTDVAPMFKDAEIGLSRSEPGWRHHSDVRETEKLHLASVAAAKKLIYMENQYFTSLVMAEALANRLEEPDGPEVVLVSTQHSPSWFDQMTMDQTRQLFIKRLRDADKHGRFSVFSPVTAKGKIIIVHSKLTIIDNELLRIGSANLNNRSTGFDTECDLSIEAAEGEAGDAARETIARFRAELVGHWMGKEGREVEAALNGGLTLGQAITALDDPAKRRLKPIPQKPVTGFPAFVAYSHLGDPAGPGDSWRPWRRRPEIRAQLEELKHELEAAGLKSAAEDLSPETV
jgi:phosphatidylserine/phosphatidylglycerophosphate/cardiolipin synthase-like enzyme